MGPIDGKVHMSMVSVMAWHYLHPKIDYYVGIQVHSNSFIKSGLLAGQSLM